jgi:hypothetical protein
MPKDHFVLKDIYAFWIKYICGELFVQEFYSHSVHFKVILHFYVAFVPNVMRVCKGMEVMFLTVEQSLFRAEPSASV